MPDENAKYNRCKNIAGNHDIIIIFFLVQNMHGPI